MDREIKVPDGQTPLNADLNHPLLNVFKEGEAARNNGTTSPYHGHSLEHCIHAAGWVGRDLRLALDASLERERVLMAALHKADAALTEAEAILGGEYGDHYGPLCEMMTALRSDITTLTTEQKS